MTDAQSNNIRVFYDTMHWLICDETLTDAVTASRRNTILFPEKQSPALPENPGYDTKITVSRMRSFEAAMKLREEYPSDRIAVHNFASATNPGGGVEHGSSAQEECLCRCSTLFPVLKKKELFDKYYNFHRERHDTLYTDACIWSPDILVIKTDTRSPERMPVSNWCKVDVLTCAAPNLREDPYNKMNPGSGRPAQISNDDLFMLHWHRARHMLSIAAAQGDTVLVLGAFGCGAFCNPPEVVAKVYRTILPEFEGYFKRIEFAVYCNPVFTENYQVFSSMLG